MPHARLLRRERRLAASKESGPPPASGFGVQGEGVQGKGVGFRVRVWSVGFRVRVWRVEGLGVRD